MKYLIIGLIASLSLNAVAQDNAAAWETDVRKAADVSIKEQKPLFLFFTGSDWCGVCMKLQREVFSQPQFQDWAKKNVILVELDFPHNKEPDPRFVEQNDLLKETFGITGFPTVVFVTPTKRQDQVYYTRIGTTGYLSGGPDVWLNAANQLLPSRK